MSNKIPYMPFYPEAYQSDRLIRSFTLEQHGAYMLLLMEMWNAGGWLPDDDRLLIMSLNITSRKWKSLRNVLISDEVLEISRENLEFLEENIVDHDLQFQPIIRIKNPDTGNIMITQKRLFKEYRQASSLLDRKREGGRKGGRSPKGVLKESPQESLKTDSGQLKDSPSTYGCETRPDQSRSRLDQSNLENTNDPPSESLVFEPMGKPMDSQTTTAHDAGGVVDNSAANSSQVPETPEPTNQNIIRELVDVYHATVEPDQHKASDWARLGQLYNAEGVESVMTGIQALADAVRTKSIRDPMAYIASVARHNRAGPRYPPAERDAVPPAWHVLRRVLDKELAKGEST